MSKATPGPWFAEQDGLWQVWHNEGIAHIAEVSVGVMPDHSGKANAHLIAAAPDLLAELQNIANADPSKWDADMRDQFQQWAQSRARAAIAKAEGDAPCAD